MLWFLAFALPKAKGMAKYVESNPAAFRRFGLVDEIDGVIKVLDLTNQNVRAAIDSANDLKLIYQGSLSSKY